MRLGRLTCHAVDDPACSCEPAGDGGDATGGGESGRLPKAFGEGDGELAITGGGVLAMDISGTSPRLV